MIHAIMTLIIALFILAISTLTFITYQKEKKEINDFTETTAKIYRTIYSDTGNVRYYVQFAHEGKNVSAQTDYYSSDTASLNPGDNVNIGYFFTKSKIPVAVILDERVKPVRHVIPVAYKATFVMGILLFIISIIMFVKL